MPVCLPPTARPPHVQQRRRRPPAPSVTPSPAQPSLIASAFPLALPLLPRLLLPTTTTPLALLARLLRSRKPCRCLCVRVASARRALPLHFFLQLLGVSPRSQLAPVASFSARPARPSIFLAPGPTEDGACRDLRSLCHLLLLPNPPRPRNSSITTHRRIALRRHLDARAIAGIDRLSLFPFLLIS